MVENVMFLQARKNNTTPLPPSKKITPLKKPVQSSPVQCRVQSRFFVICVGRSVQYRKWSPTANDPETANDPRPQVIPKVDRKWSRKKNRNDLDSS